MGDGGASRRSDQTHQLDLPGAPEGGSGAGTGALSSNPLQQDGDGVSNLLVEKTWVDIQPTMELWIGKQSCLPRN